MKIVVIGGTGLIDSKTVATLRRGGHEVVAASPKSGINSVTGEGLKQAVAGAEMMTDHTNSPLFGDKAVLEHQQPRGPILWRSHPGAHPRAVRRSAPRPHRFGRMVPQHTSGCLI